MSGPSDDPPSAADVLRELRGAFADLAGDFAKAFEKFQDEAQYRFDKELGKQLSKHPELYAELRRGYKQVKRGVDKVAREWGLR